MTKDSGDLNAAWKSLIVAATAVLAVTGVIVAVLNLPIISGVVPR